MRIVPGFVGAVVAMVLSASDARAIAGWGAHGPGAGGLFTSVAVSSSNRVLVGSDVSGMYGRNGTSGNWTRIGTLDGIMATKILDIQFSFHNPSRAITGTGAGAYYSTSSGASWTRVTDSDVPTDHNIGVVAWSTDSDDSLFALLAWNDATTADVRMASTADGGATWATVSHDIPDSGLARVPIKILIRPYTTGSTREIFLLMGVSIEGGAAREIWHSTNNGTNFTRIVKAGGTAINPIDMVFVAGSIGASNMLITTSTSSDPSDNSAGSVYGVNISTWTWARAVIDDTYNPTGVCWSTRIALPQGGLATRTFLLTVDADACGDPNNDAAGIWMEASGTWTRVDDGRGTGGGTTTWADGWVNCQLARGQTEDNVANSVTSQGKYWITKSFIWRYESDQFVNDFTTTESSPFFSTYIDNVNPVTIELDGNGDPWVGYYDIGLWKISGGAPEEKNTATGSGGWGGDEYRGNVSGLWIDGSTILAIGAASSKDENWRLYRSTNTGSSWSAYGNLPYAANQSFLYGLTKDPSGSSPKFWITHNGQVFHSTDANTWSAVSNNVSGGGLPPRGLTMVRAYGGTVLAGGWNGFYRSTNNGSTWSAIASGSFNLQGCLGDTSLTLLYQKTYHGIQDLHYNVASAEWWATSYMKPNPCGGTPPTKGLLRSADGGATWTAMEDSVLRRGVYVDSCGRRVHLTSGEGFSSGPNSDAAINRATGKKTCRWDGGGSFFCVPEVATSTSSDPLYRNPTGNAVRAYEGTSSCRVYVAAQGYGVMAHDVPCAGEDPCSFDKRGPVKVEDPEVAPRTTFRLAEIRGRVLYDVSGRKVRVVHAGVYFDPVIEKGKITSRRTVLVTP